MTYQEAHRLQQARHMRDSLRERVLVWCTQGDYAMRRRVHYALMYGASVHRAFRMSKEVHID